jgi:two-component system cell cycle response regulator DivK
MAIVLVIEDEEANMRLATELLQMNGYEVLQARTGQEGLYIANEHQPDLILMDFELPGMTGLEILRELKSSAKTKAIKVIAVTARAMVGDEAMIKDAGADHYLSKPYKYQDFLHIVKEYCG